MIIIFYMNASDAQDSGLEAGWYFESNNTEVPQGPYPSELAAETAALIDLNEAYQ